MELPVVLVLVLVLPTTSAETLNSRWQDLLPQDCGWRLVEFHHELSPITRRLIHGQFPWQARIMVSGSLDYTHQCGGVIIV